MCGSVATTKKKVQVWIFHRDPHGVLWTLLLQTLPRRGSFWQPVTGSVEKGETLEQAALREAWEETGFSFGTGVLNSEWSFSYLKNGNRFEEHGFALQVDQMGEPVLDSREHQGFRWIRVDDAAAMLAYPSNIDLLKFWIHQLRFER